MSVLSQSKQNVRILDLRLPQGFNVRSEPISEAERDMLAASIEAHGLVHDISVEEAREGIPVDNKPVYVVTDGFGRAEALRHLLEERGWDPDTQVTVNVVTYGERVDPALRNLVENEHRRPLKTADKAKRLFELTSGICPDPRGGYVPKLSVARLAKELQTSPGYVRELVRAWGKSCEELRVAWVKEGVRTDHVREWCKLSKRDQQKMLRAHLTTDVAVSEGEGDADAEDDEGGETEPKPSVPTKKQVREQIDILTRRMAEKQAQQTLRSTQEYREMRAAANALLWATGQTKQVMFSDTNGGSHEQESARAAAER